MDNQWDTGHGLASQVQIAKESLQRMISLNIDDARSLGGGSSYDLAMDHAETLEQVLNTLISLEVAAS
jgi:hypothetical protein